jgi:hypothetical protein
VTGNAIWKCCKHDCKYYKQNRFVFDVLDTMRAWRSYRGHSY